MRTKPCPPVPQVLRTISDGLVVFLLERGDSSKAMLRAVTRELLAAAVLRNIMFYFTPYTLNKVGVARVPSTVTTHGRTRVRVLFLLVSCAIVPSPLTTRPCSTACLAQMMQLTGPPPHLLCADAAGRAAAAASAALRGGDGGGGAPAGRLCQERGHEGCAAPKRP